jgi:tRNA(fMet)-specific endonuclease VapC
MTALPRYLLDTNICIYIRWERPQAVLDPFNVLPAGSIAISIITYSELRYGSRRALARARP